MIQFMPSWALLKGKILKETRAFLRSDEHLKLVTETRKSKGSSISVDKTSAKVCCSFSLI